MYSVLGLVIVFIVFVINIYIAYYVMEMAVASGTYKAITRAKSGLKSA